MIDISGQAILVVGGGSGIGEAVARGAAAAGASVAIAGRSPERLDAAAARIGRAVAVHCVDIRDDASVAALAAAVGAVDHLVVTASQVDSRPVRELEMASAVASMDSKLFGPLRVARAIAMRDGGSITLTSGIASRKHLPGMAMLGAVNAAVEALAKGLAAEWAPLRVNAVSPGLVDTPLYDAMGAEAKAAFLAGFAKRMPLRRIGTPDDVAAAVLMLVRNPYATGSVVDVDGGGLLN